jgi:microcystin degradation protein MlrC
MTAEKLRVGIIGIYHESNTFIPEPTTLEHYRNSTFLLGEDIRARYSSAHHEVSGFLQTLAEANIEAVPIIFAHTSPWGKVTDEALDTIWSLVCEGLDRAGPLDGILAAPHGAAVNESRQDMDGWWLGELRKRIGPGIPIIATMDPHVNFSPAMATACDAAIAYRENPHLDQRERGIEAANLMVRTLRGEIRPVCAAAFPPVAINIERQLTWAEPMLSVQRELERARQMPGILSASVALGFPYADVPEMGSSFVVVADNNLDLAREQAGMLAAWLVENRERFRGEMISPKEALERVENSPKPVGLLDMGDNMGGGSPADSTVLARLCEDTGRYRAFVCLADSESVQAAMQAGIGARLQMKLGGKLPMSPAPPMETFVTVLSFHEGIYTETQARHGGKTGGDMGPTVIVKSDRGLTIMLTTRRTGPFSLQPLLSCGIRPEDFDVIIIKGVHAPIGAYAEACPTFIRVNTPGVTTADMESLTYQHRRTPLFPFEEI